MSATETVVRRVLRDVLSIGGRAENLTESSALVGAIPELDSMAVVNVIAAFEDELGIVIEDDEISGEIFATFGSLVKFVANKTNGS